MRGSPVFGGRVQRNRRERLDERKCRVCGKPAQGYHEDLTRKMHVWKHSFRPRGSYTRTTYCELPVDSSKPLA